MKQSICKKIFVLFMVLFTTLNAFYVNAAIVSDNDGATFVTKAEFDALKNSFNKQIDDYNSSIDGKIDGAIASYLAGIQLAKTEDRSQIITGISGWSMYGNDYPQYVDGVPYVTGFTAQGHKYGSGGTRASTAFVAILFNGDESKITDGGFKKHIVGKPSKNSAKNGNDNFVAEWQGYYEKEGEQISCASSDGANDTVWAVSLENNIRFDAQVTFKNAECPVQIAAARIQTDDENGNTTFNVYCSAAQRIIGQIVGDTCVSIYKPINDNRFYDSTVANKMGITPTTPAITYYGRGATFLTNFATAVPTVSAKLSCAYYNQETVDPFRWVAYEYPSRSWTKDIVNFYNEQTINDYRLQSATRDYYYWKMANDPNNLQFDRLWTGRTDGVAALLDGEYNSSSTSVERKTQIKKALLWDENNVAHLSMGAGYPFLSVEEEEKVSFNFKITDDTGSGYTGDYYVFGKYGPFSSTGDAESEADVVFTNGGTVTAHPKAFKIAAGVQGTLKFDVTKTDNIYLKWVKSDMAGGGRMDVSVNPTVTLKQ